MIDLLSGNSMVCFRYTRLRVVDLWHEGQLISMCLHGCDSQTIGKMKWRAILKSHKQRLVAITISSHLKIAVFSFQRLLRVGSGSRRNFRHITNHRTLNEEENLRKKGGVTEQLTSKITGSGLSCWPPTLSMLTASEPCSSPCKFGTLCDEIPLFARLCCRVRNMLGLRGCAREPEKMSWWRS
jgi:hypothetical protein